VFIEKYRPARGRGRGQDKTEFGLFLVSTARRRHGASVGSGWKRPGEQVIEEYKKGDRVKAQVLDVDVEKERISLASSSSRATLRGDAEPGLLRHQEGSS